MLSGYLLFVLSQVDIESLAHFGVFRRRKTHLFGVFRPLKSDGALLELYGALIWPFLAFSGAGKRTFLAFLGP